jgi:hypothetical protein
LHNEKLHNLYTSPNIIRVIRARRMRWAGACSMQEMRCIQNFGWKLKGRNHSEDLGIDGSNIRMGIGEIG